jgi:hypothetical protein
LATLKDACTQSSRQESVGRSVSSKLDA